MPKTFIFLSSDGSTFLPNSESSVPDIENLQVLGYGKGTNSHEAFMALLREQKYLISSGYSTIIAHELRCEEGIYLNMPEGDLR